MLIRIVLIFFKDLYKFINLPWILDQSCLIFKLNYNWAFSSRFEYVKKILITPGRDYFGLNEMGEDCIIYELK